MRCSPAFHLLPASLLVSQATALQLPHLQPFTSALANIFDDLLPNALDNNTAHHDLLKRQSSNTCPVDYADCASLGAPNLCCISNAVCSADQAGMVACCPNGAVCTGTITGYITSGTVDSNGVLVGGGAAATTSNSALVGTTAPTTSFQFYTSSSTDALVPAVTSATDGATITGGFIVAGSSTVATPGAGARQAEIVRIPILESLLLLTVTTASCCPDPGLRLGTSIPVNFTTHSTTLRIQDGCNDCTEPLSSLASRASRWSPESDSPYSSDLVCLV